MEEMIIERQIGKDKVTIMLTEDELERAYQIKERRYLDEDFANALADAVQDPDTLFHAGHLEEFPELTDWLRKCFDDFYDANMSHNDLMELTLNHLQHVSIEPDFFLFLAGTAPAFCMGTEKNLEDCEQNCGQYHRCSSIAEANDRSRQWETLASLLSMHRSGNCTCSEDGDECPAAKYLAGTSYYVEDIPDDQIGYIVTEDFLAPTKGVPLVQRLYHDIFDDQDTAQNYAKNLKLHDLQYPKSIVTFLVCNRQKTSMQPWYQSEMEALKLMEEKGQTYLNDSFCIFTKSHIENLKKLSTKETA